MYFELMKRNSRRSRKENGIFFASLVITIVAFYIILSLEQQDVMIFLRTMESDAVRKLMGLIPVLYGFSLVILFFLIFYAETYQMERRSHEFGMYLMLGMTRGKMMGMLLLEDLWSSVLALLAGIPAAVFLSELTSLITARSVGLGIIHHSFSFSGKAVLLAALGFILIKMAAFLILCRKTTSMEISHLLSEEQEKSRKEMKKGRCLLEFVLGILCLAVAYGGTMSRAVWREPGAMGIFVLLGLAGTFLLFWGLRAGIELLIGKKRGKGGLGTFIFRELQESMLLRPNVLAVTSLLVLLALCCAGYGVGVGASSRNMEKHVLDYTFDGEADEIRAALERPELAPYLERYFQVRMGILFTEDGTHSYSWDGVQQLVGEQKYTAEWEMVQQNLAQYTSPYVIALSGYNQILEAAGKEPITLNDHQAALYVGPRFSTGNVGEILRQAAARHPQISIDGEKYEITAYTGENVVVDRMITLSYCVVVEDTVFDQLAGDSCSSYWDAVLRKEILEEKGLMRAIMEVNAILDKTGLIYESYLQNMGRQLFYSVAGSYITLYLAVIFLIIANTVLAVQFLMQQRRNGKRYQILTKLGSEYSMLCSAARMQIRWYFGLPVAVAMLGSFFGVRSLITGMLPSESGEKFYLILGIAITMILLLCVVEWIYIRAVMRLSDRGILEKMEMQREE